MEAERVILEAAQPEATARYKTAERKTMVRRRKDMTRLCSAEREDALRFSTQVLTTNKFARHRKEAANEQTVGG